MAKRTVVPIGPYHPLQEEPEHFRLYVEGERVVEIDIEIGYNHRGIERLAENLTFDQVPFLVERICGICSTSHPIACVQAIEEAGGIDVPERALYIRSLVGEFERIHSHLLWLGLAGHFLGYNTVWMWAWKYREPVLDLFELMTGNRNHYAMMKPGGVRRDIADEDIPTALGILDDVEKHLLMLKGAVLDDPVIHARTEGIGVLSRQDILDYGAVGPTARASGVAIDVRRDYPYAAYDLIDWDVAVTENGDVFDKVVVRIVEMLESVRICRACLGKLRTVRGAIDSDPKEVPPGEGVGQHEAPRGEVVHYTRSDGTNRPVRHKVRAPTYVNLPTSYRAVVGHNISDACIILAAIDPCYCCTERMAVISPEGDRLMDGKDLVRLSQERTEAVRRRMGVKT